MPNIGRQIIDSFEDIGKSVVNETVKIPSDIAGKAIESLGTSSGKTPKAKSAAGSRTGPVGEKSSNSDDWDAIDKTDDRKIKQAIARSAIAALVNRNKPKVPSVRERIEAEEKQKKEQAEDQAEALAKAQLPVVGSKQPVGDLYGKHAKQTSVENKNIKSD